MCRFTVGAGLLAKAVCQPSCLSLIVYISIAAVTAAYGFALHSPRTYGPSLRLGVPSEGGGGWIKIKSCRRANARPVGTAAGCDLLILIFRLFGIVKNQNQKIAACGSSYRETRTDQNQAGR
ncbi:hypothetical protein C1X64_25330 [Pseudomonas sp. GW456-E7]|nr:hypothetical protein C1X64_25330 [Pseudomonas sp. GW456-E7]